MINLQALTCGNCHCSILLPSPTHPGISPSQSSWPMDGKPRNFLCPRCTHVYEYSIASLLPGLSDGGDPRLGRKGRRVVCIAVPCGIGGCASLIKIDAIMLSNTDLFAESAALISQAVAHGIACESGHRSSGPKIGAGSLGCGFDEDWNFY
jgi:hypothetical protein